MSRLRKDKMMEALEALELGHDLDKVYSPKARA